MSIVQDLTRNVQGLVDELAEEIGRECDLIKRKRKFTASTLAKTFVFGFLRDPKASDEQLAQMAGILGVQVTPQAVEQRFTAELAQFLQTLFERAANWVLTSSGCSTPLLQRFSDVLLIDSTTISLPSELAELFPGCGGSYGGGKAAVKLQVQLSLRTGNLDAVRVEPGRDCDMKTPLQQRPLPAGALRIADLGYFNTRVFKDFENQDAYWLSRLLYGTNLYDVDGTRFELIDRLRSRGSLVDEPILLGADHQVPCRLIAWRVPPEVAAERRRKLKETHRDKGRTPSSGRLAWCDWMILVTNVPDDLLTVKEASVLYRARWQVELLFKRWKSQGFVDELEGTTVVRKMVRLWARLLAVVVQNWLVVAHAWGNPQLSLKKACDAVRSFAVILAAGINSNRGLQNAFNLIGQALRSTARQNKRKKPNTFQLLQNPDLLEYSLT